MAAPSSKLVVLLAFLCLFSPIFPLSKHKDEDIIEDISKEALDEIVKKSDYVAVYFYTKNCPDCDTVLHELENIDDDTDHFGIGFVKINDKALARRFGVASFPALVFFRNQQPVIYNGDLKNEEKVLDWLTSMEGMELPDEIEDVNTKMLNKIINENDNVAAYFYAETGCKECEATLKELENIDDDCDQHDIKFVKVVDPAAAKTYSFKKLPALIYFRNKEPLNYDGDLKNEEKVLEWLVQNKVDDDDDSDNSNDNTNGDDDDDDSDVIEDMSKQMLERLLEEAEAVAVFFYTSNCKECEKTLAELENIDDDTDKIGVHFVKISDPEIAKEYGVEEFPALMYFENELPTMYEGDLSHEEEVLAWLHHHKHEDTIENVNEEILEKIIEEQEYVVLLFYSEGCKECEIVIDELEHIDDDTDKLGISFLKTNDDDLAKQYNIKSFPTLLYFRNHGNPIQYKGDLTQEDKVLEWLTSPEAMEIADQIEDVNRLVLEKILEVSDFVAVYFYDEHDSNSDKVLQELENIDDDTDKHGIDFVKISDPQMAKEYGLHKLPALVYYRNKYPMFYDGDLKKEEEVLQWLIDNKQIDGDDEIEDISRASLNKLFEESEFVAVYFYDKNCKTCDATLKELENIDDDTDQHGIQFVKIADANMAAEYGVKEVPALIYFENKVPSIYEGDLTNEDKVLQWLITNRNEDTIETVNREIFLRLIDEEDYIAVFFYTGEHEDDEMIIQELEHIDDDTNKYGIHFVKTTDTLLGRRYGVKSFPALVYFRHTNSLVFKGDLKDEDKLLEWLTDLDIMETKDAIEQVNKFMFKKILERSEYVAAYFYTDNCRQCDKVLHELENIDDKCDHNGIDFVKINDIQLAREYGVHAVPSLVFFNQKEPVIFAGDLRMEEKVLEWLLEQKSPEGDVIEEISRGSLEKLIDEEEHVAVYFYNKGCGECDHALEELENIDDDTDKHGIHFVKMGDTSFARDYGVKNFPALVYFEKGIPSVFEGDLRQEEDVLQWLITNKNEDTIENVNREMLEQMIEEAEYLAVYFDRNNCKECEKALQKLENIDDDTDKYGIDIVRISDTQLAKRYGIKTFPALIYFRNGNPLIFDGDLKKDDDVLQWLIDPATRELVDEIEEVNSRMLNRLLEESNFLCVFFYEDDCPECDLVLQELENIDDEADGFGIDFVKISDPDVTRHYRVLHVPAIIYFRRQIPMVYEGDLMDEEALLTWLTSDETLDIKNEIEDVNRKLLEKLLDDKDYVAVYFYEKNCKECEEVLKELEKIDDDTDELDINFVKINDHRLARKYGIYNNPSLVYFRRKYPAIYRGDLHEEEEVLTWLTKNRYRHPELNLFMYAVGAITLAFVLYSVFLIFCFKKEKKE